MRELRGGPVDGLSVEDAGRSSPLHAEIAADDPFLACRHFSALVQEAVFAVAMEQDHADFELGDDRRRWSLAL